MQDVMKAKVRIGLISWAGVVLSLHAWMSTLFVSYVSSVDDALADILAMQYFYVYTVVILMCNTNAWKPRESPLSFCIICSNVLGIAVTNCTLYRAILEMASGSGW